MLFGCKSEEIVCGGKVVNTDKDAPKMIVSKDIKEFSVHFYIDYYLQAGDDDYSGIYDFTIKDGTLSSSGMFTMSESIDDKLLKDVQEIIDKYELVKLNGKDEYTSGLPIECQPCYLKAVYESGEVLYFCEDNNPNAGWSKDMFVIFRQYFIEKGHEELKSSKEARTISRFHIIFNKDDTGYKYSEIIDADEVKKLRKNEYNLDTKEGKDYIVNIPENFYDRLSELVNGLNISQFCKGDMVFSPSDFSYTKDCYYEIYIGYENGHKIYGYSADKERIEEFNKGIAPVKEYLDSLFK